MNECPDKIFGETPDEMREWELSDRFDRGDLHASTPDERRIVKTYELIRGEMKRHPVPVIDRSAIMRVLKNETGEQPSQSSSRWRRLKPVFAYGGFTGFLILFGLLVFFFQPKPVQQIRISGEPQAVSWLWKTRMQWGKPVTIPKKCEAELQLADGSIVSCSPETRIAVRFDTNREIDLDRGAITVHAAHIESSTMVVQTPLLKINVVGTVFHVEVGD